MRAVKYALVSSVIFCLIFIFILLIAVTESNDLGTSAGNLITTELPEVLTDEMIGAAMEAEEDYKVPASVLLSQIILEASGDYKNNLNQIAYECRNLLMKRGKGPIGSKVYEITDENGKTSSVRFRKYKSYRQCIREISESYVTGNYAKETKKAKDVDDWIDAICKVGYPNKDGYSDELRNTILIYDLERFDSGGIMIGDGISQGNFIFPTVKNSVITSYFGEREIGIGSTYHQGIDIGVYGNEPGAAIYAADGGKVEATGKTASMGNYVRISHDDGIVTVYMHMQNNSVCVRKGQKVSRGQKIGRMGSTGISSGTHLHFEVRINGTAVDPLRFVSKD